MQAQTPDDDNGIFGQERRLLTLGILMAIAVFAVEGMGVVPALPVAVRELGGLPLFGWAFSGFMLAWLVGTVSGGLLADARGPRLPMAVGLSGFATGLLLASGAHGMPQFLAGRALQGMGGGAMMASSYVAVARGYPDALRPRVMAVISTVWIVPAFLGPVISGAVTEKLGWRFVFAGVVPFIALTALAVLPAMRRLDTRRPAAGMARLKSALRAALGGVLLFASPNLVPQSKVGAGAMLVGGALLFIPALRALLPAGTFRVRPGLPAGLVTRALLAFSFFGTEAFVPLTTTELRHASPTQAGLTLTAGALGWICASWTLDRVEARVGARLRGASVRGGLFLVSVGIALVASVLLSSLPLALLLVGWVLSGVGMGLAYSAGGLICIAAAPKGQEGEVSGQLQLAEALSTATATALGGSLLAALVESGVTPNRAHAAVFSVTISAALIGSVLAGRLGPRKGLRPFPPAGASPERGAPIPGSTRAGGDHESPRA